MGFTKAAARRGGWARARQWAQHRRANPTEYEKVARQALQHLGWRWWAEVEIVHRDTGMPQFLDLVARAPALGLVAIEVDGSAGWHGDTSENYTGRNRTMAWYDMRKRELLRARGVPLVELDHKTTQLSPPECAQVLTERLQQVAHADGLVQQSTLF